MANVIRYNPYGDRLELMGSDREIFFTQVSEQIKALYVEPEQDDNRFVFIGNNTYYNISREFLPNLQDVDRRFISRIEAMLIDSIAARNAQLLLPTSSITALTVITFTDLSGVTIVSYAGNQLLSISGNTIVSSGVGNVFDLLLSDGTFIPFLYSGWDVSVNGNHAIDIVNCNLVYSATGSTYLFDKGGVIRGVFEWDGESQIDSFIASGSQEEILPTLTGTRTTTWIRCAGLKTITKSDTDRFAWQYKTFSGVIKALTDGVVKDIPLDAELIRCYWTRTFGSPDTEVSFTYEKRTIPNDVNGNPILPIEYYDTLVNGSDFINTSPFKVRLFTIGDTDFEYAFFDKSNVLIWKDTLRASTQYRTDDTGLWDSSELTQQFIYDHIQDAYKYHFWSKVMNGQFSDLFLYNTALPYPACTAKNYVRLGELISTPGAGEIPCGIDRPN